MPVNTKELLARRGDITQLEVDAIVNAANERMLGGGGVDGAIHAAAGPALLAACRAAPEVRPGVRCPTGEARITPGFNLPAKHVIHTVGPIWSGGAQREPELLASCYDACLTLAETNHLRSMAFPAISTGVFGYPLLPACRIAAERCSAFLKHSNHVSRIVLVGFSRDAAEALEQAVEQVRIHGIER